jgi:lysophospholipase L1-like esterase
MVRTLFTILLIWVTIQTSGQRITIGPEVSMLALGDSFTIGESVSTQERWPHQFIAELRKSGVSAEDPDYLATTGWTTRGLLLRMGGIDESGKEYNLVSILIGANNQYQGLDFSIYEPELRQIIEGALDVVDRDTSRVFILSIPDYAYTPFGNGDSNISQEIDTYNASKKEIADQYGIAFIDITPISRNGLNDPKLVAGDGLHPSGQQYLEWVQEIIPLLEYMKPAAAASNDVDITPSIEVYPNPASNQITIDSSNTIRQVQISNSNGGLVYLKKIEKLPVTVSVSHLSPGVYILALMGDSPGIPVEVRKLVIKNN